MDTAALAAICAGLSVLLLISGVARHNRGETVEDRLSQLVQHGRPPIDDALHRPLGERLFRPALGGLGVAVTRIAPNRALDSMQKNLIRADLDSVFDGSTFLALRIFAGLGFGLCLLSLMLLSHAAAGTALFFGFGGLILAYVLPAIWLQGRAKSRQNAIRASLPDLLDLLALCIGTLSMDKALARIVDQVGPELQVELKRLLRLFRTGTDLIDAMLEFAARVQIEELDLLAATLDQSRRLGARLEDALFAQSADMRVRRRQRAETLAHEAPIKMMFPLILLVFPPLFIVILGPAIPQIIHTVAPQVHL